MQVDAYACVEIQPGLFWRGRLTYVGTRRGVQYCIPRVITHSCAQTIKGRWDRMGIQLGTCEKRDTSRKEGMNSYSLKGRNPIVTCSGIVVVACPVTAHFTYNVPLTEDVSESYSQSLMLSA